jgi:hypothetical protein
MCLLKARTHKIGVRAQGSGLRNVTERVLGLLFAAAFLSLWLLSVVVPAADGQAAKGRSDLQVSLDTGLANLWSVRSAGLHEDLVGTTGSLRIQNVSAATVRDAVFYGEYFDAAGRFCFSLVFSLANNGVNGSPVAPGELREIYASSAGLFAASPPNQLRLFQVRQDVPDHPYSPMVSDFSLRVPVTIFGSVRGNATKIDLLSEQAQASKPMVDLILAELKVDATGSVNSIDILSALSGQMEVWFRDFVRRELMVYPATNNGVPVSGSALLLVRITPSEKQLANSEAEAWMSDWVKSYVTHSVGDEVPPVTEIVFQRPPTKIKRMGTTDLVERPPAPTGQFEILLIGSDYSRQAFRSVSDPSMPHKMRFELDVPNSH